MTLLYCRHGWICWQALTEIFSPPGSFWSQIWSIAFLRVTPLISVRNFAVTSIEATKAADFTVRDAGLPLRRQYFIFPYSKACFFRDKMCSVRRWLPRSLLKGCHCLIYGLTCVFSLYLHSNIRHQTLHRGIIANTYYCQCPGLRSCALDVPNIESR